MRGVGGGGEGRGGMRGRGRERGSGGRESGCTVRTMRRTYGRATSASERDLGPDSRFISFLIVYGVILVTLP